MLYKYQSKTKTKDNTQKQNLWYLIASSETFVCYLVTRMKVSAQKHLFLFSNCTVS